MMRRGPKYLASEDRHRDRWVFSYVDFVTVLLVLFIAAASAAIQPKPLEAKPKLEPLNTPPIAAKTPEIEAPKAETSDLKAPEAQSDDTLRAQEQLARRFEDRGLTASVEARGVVVSLPQSVLFRAGDDRIRRSAQPVIAQIAEVIAEIPNDVQLAGNTDGVPIHNRRFEDNWQLAAARSLQLLEVLTSRYRIAPSRLAALSYGAERPRVSNDSAQGRAENRRVEIIICAAQPKP